MAVAALSSAAKIAAINTPTERTRFTDWLCDILMVSLIFDVFILKIYNLAGR
jgi:hypothetical protein